MGPVVVMVRVSTTGLAVPARIVGALQVTVVSGRPLHAKVTLPAKLVTPTPVAVTVKVEVVCSPASTAAGVVGLEIVKVGEVTFTTAGVVDVEGM